MSRSERSDARYLQAPLSFSMQLRALGLQPAQITTLQECWPVLYGMPPDPEKALHQFLRDPYPAVSALGDASFDQLDALALQHGLPPYAVHRLHAFALHILARWQQETGAGCMAKSRFFARFAELDGRVAYETMAAALRGHADVVEIDDLLMLRDTAREISRSREALLRLTREGAPLYNGADLSAAMDDAEAALAHRGFLGLQQRNALFRLLSGRQRLHCWQAGPATGKKTLLAIVCHVLRQRRHLAFSSACHAGALALHRFLMAYGHGAQSLHQLLAPVVDGGRLRYGWDEGHPLAAELIVVDACQALTLRMLSCLLSAVGSQTHLLLIGDTQCLPLQGGDGCLNELCRWPGDQQWLETGYHPSPAIQACLQALSSLHFDWSYYPSVCHRYFSAQRNGDEAVIQAWQQARALAPQPTDVALVLCAASLAGSQVVLSHFNAILQNLCNPRHAGNALRDTNLRSGDPLWLCRGVPVAVAGAWRWLCLGEYARLQGQDARNGDLLLRLSDGAEARLPAEQRTALQLAYALTPAQLPPQGVASVIAVLVDESYPEHDSRLLYSLFAATRQHITLFARRATLDALAAKPVSPTTAGLAWVRGGSDG